MKTSVCSGGRELIFFAQHFLWEMHMKPWTCGLDTRGEHQWTDLHLPVWGRMGGRVRPQVVPPMERQKEPAQRFWVGESSSLDFSLLTYKAGYRLNENVQTTKRNQTHASFCCVHFLNNARWTVGFCFVLLIRTVPESFSLKKKGRGILQKGQWQNRCPFCPRMTKTKYSR